MAKKDESLPKLLGDNVLILPEDAPSVTPGGIVLPDVAKHKEVVRRGEVAAVGPGLWNAEGRCYDPTHVAPGDVVLFSVWGEGLELELRGKTYLLVHESDIIGVM